jgi:hypothetical protein
MDERDEVIGLELPGLCNATAVAVSVRGGVLLLLSRTAQRDVFGLRVLADE